MNASHHLVASIAAAAVTTVVFSAVASLADPATSHAMLARAPVPAPATLSATATATATAAAAPVAPAAAHATQRLALPAGPMRADG